MRLAPIPGALLLLAGCASSSQPAPHAPASPAPSVQVQVAAAVPHLPAQDVTLAFDRGLFHMEGTLSLPEREAGAKVPAAVIVHGSGPMSRDGLMRGQIGLGFGFELPVYKRLAEALVARGYAVYRYDKRSCGQFNDCNERGPSGMQYDMVEGAFNTRELAADAETAMDMIAARPEVDAGRTFFIGHSEGGELVPLLLSERPAVRAGVMLAPPFNTMSVVLKQQAERVRWAFAAAGEPERGEAEGKILGEAALSVGNVERGTHFGEPILGQPAGLWASWVEMARKAPEIARGLDRPLLVLGGGYDYNVAPSEIESWATWLGVSPKAPHRVKVLPCVTHALNCIAQPEPGRITPADIGRDVAPEVVDEVARFLASSNAADRP